MLSKEQKVLRFNLYLAISNMSNLPLIIFLIKEGHTMLIPKHSIFLWNIFLLTYICSAFFSWVVYLWACILHVSSKMGRSSTAQKFSMYSSSSLQFPLRHWKTSIFFLLAPKFCILQTHIIRIIHYPFLHWKTTWLFPNLDNSILVDFYAIRLIKTNI